MISPYVSKKTLKHHLKKVIKLTCYPSDASPTLDVRRQSQHLMFYLL